MCTPRGDQKVHFHFKCEFLIQNRSRASRSFKHDIMTLAVASLKLFQSLLPFDLLLHFHCRMHVVGRHHHCASKYTHVVLNRRAREKVSKNESHNIAAFGGPTNA